MTVDHLDKTQLDYKRAYEREKQARAQMERMLEDKTREVYSSNQQLLEQYQELESRSLENEFLYAVVSMTDERLTIDQALLSFSKKVCDIFKLDLACVYRPDIKNENQLNYKGFYSSDLEGYADFDSCMQELSFEVGKGIPGETYQYNDIQLYTDLRHDSPRSSDRVELLMSMGLYKAFCLPIHSYEKIIGIVEFFYKTESGFQDKTLEVVLTAAHQLGGLIERRESENDLQKNFQQTKIMNEKLMETQEQLVQSEKMASIGQLSAGVAHEINNPIAFVISNVSTLKEYIDITNDVYQDYQKLIEAVESSNLEEAAKQIAKIKEFEEEEDFEFVIDDMKSIAEETNIGATRVKDIVKGLKSFSRTDQGIIEKADLNECIDQTIKIAWNELKYKCEIVKKFNPLPEINCLAGQINQVLMNLIVNAGQAIEEKGTITIETDVVGMYISIKISDDGKGIPQENIEKLFNPFFTTKAVGQGTGLGLSISYGIIQRHKGKIEVTSEVGKGTCFEIKLPFEGITEEDLKKEAK